MLIAHDANVRYTQKSGERDFHLPSFTGVCKQSPNVLEVS